MTENQGRFGPHLGIESLALWWRRLGAGQKPGYCEQMLLSWPDAPLWSSEETLQNCYRSLTKVRTWPPSTAPARRAPDLGVSQPCSVTWTCLPAFWGLLGGLPRARRLCTLLLALTFLSPNTSTPSTIVGTYRGPRALGTRGGAQRGCPEGDGGLLADAGEARATTLPCGGRRVRAASPPQHVLDTGSSLVCVEARPHEGQWRACLKMLNLSTPVPLRPLQASRLDWSDAHRTARGCKTGWDKLGERREGPPASGRPDGHAPGAQLLGAPRERAQTRPGRPSVSNAGRWALVQSWRIQWGVLSRSRG